MKVSILTLAIYLILQSAIASKNTTEVEKDFNYYYLTDKKARLSRETDDFLAVYRAKDLSLPEETGKYPKEEEFILKHTWTIGICAKDQNTLHPLHSTEFTSLNAGKYIKCNKGLTLRKFRIPLLDLKLPSKENIQKNPKSELIVKIKHKPFDWAFGAKLDITITKELALILRDRKDAILIDITKSLITIFRNGEVARKQGNKTPYKGMDYFIYEYKSDANLKNLNKQVLDKFEKVETPSDLKSVFENLTNEDWNGDIKEAIDLFEVLVANTSLTALDFKKYAFLPKQVYEDEMAKQEKERIEQEKKQKERRKAEKPIEKEAAKKPRSMKMGVKAKFL